MRKSHKFKVEGNKHCGDSVIETNLAYQGMTRSTGHKVLNFLGTHDLIAIEWQMNEGRELKSLDS